jgi:hypothetical protein
MLRPEGRSLSFTTSSERVSLLTVRITHFDGVIFRKSECRKVQGNVCCARMSEDVSLTKRRLKAFNIRNSVRAELNGVNIADFFGCLGRRETQEKEEQIECNHDDDDDSDYCKCKALFLYHSCQGYAAHVLQHLFLTIIYN